LFQKVITFPTPVTTKFRPIKKTPPLRGDLRDYL
jgi:hypothetical protein